MAVLGLTGEVDGYIYLGQQTPAFYAKQVVASLVDYGMTLLPPFFGGLVAYDSEANISPKDAYEALVANEVDYVSLDKIKGRISATLALIYPPGIGVIVPGERWDAKAQPMLDYFLAFQESFNRFPGFNYEVQGVFQERVNGRIKFHTYVVRE